MLHQHRLHLVLYQVDQWFRAEELLHDEIHLSYLYYYTIKI